MATQIPVDSDNPLIIHATGKAFSEGVYDLRLVATIAQNYCVILDKLSAAVITRDPNSKRMGSKMDYRTRIDEGSIQFLIDFLALSVSISATGLSPTTLMDSVVFLYGSIMDRWKNPSPHISTQNIAPQPSIKIYGDHNIIITNSVISDASKAIAGPIKSIQQRMDGEALNSITVKNNNGQSQWTADDNLHIYTDSGLQTLPEKVSIVGRLNRVVFDAKEGTIVTLDKSKVSVIWEPKLRTEIQKASDIEGVKFTAHPMVTSDTRQVKCYHIIKCDSNINDPQFSLF